VLERGFACVEDEDDSRPADTMPSWDDFEREWVPSDSDDEGGTPDGSEDEEGDEDD
jgi:hypothetical protein